MQLICYLNKYDDISKLKFFCYRIINNIEIMHIKERETDDF